MKKVRATRWAVGLAVIGAVLAFPVAAIADIPTTTQGATGVVNSGNFVVCVPSATNNCTTQESKPTCAKLGRADITSSVLFTSGGSSTEPRFSFSSVTPVGIAVIKGGDGYVQYTYPDPGVTSDGNLTTPNNTGNGGHSGLSHYVFCAGSGTLAVTLRSVTAKRTAKGATVNWRTASEVDVAGYNVYGLVHGKRVKLNSHIIASKGSGANSYSFSYRTPQGKRAPAAFWLQAINLDGTRTMRAARIVH